MGQNFVRAKGKLRKKSRTLMSQLQTNVHRQQYRSKTSLIMQPQRDTFVAFSLYFLVGCAYCYLGDNKYTKLMKEVGLCLYWVLLFCLQLLSVLFSLSRSHQQNISIVILKMNYHWSKKILVKLLYKITFI